jgi:flagellar hook-associated protein FlgK
MLGEIIKSTEALRYHAKSAEIAGQNLAHVNDETYARQRVLAKEGLMHRGQGGLHTSSLEGTGLDHARNDLLDKRVFSEFGESASLEAQIEILNLLQAALGETINRSGVDGGLDLEHDSNLAEGGLARALDDLFNAFQELSASPDESNAKQEIFQKIQTLTKRFNDAGKAIDEIETDISNNVESAVGQVNRLLDQIYEVNLQIKRFELLGQGKAVTYRDNRQGLLEDLSKLMNFRLQPELSEDGAYETGFLNLFGIGSDGEEVELLSTKNGVLKVTKDFGNVIDLVNESGNGAKVRAKVSSDGTLGHIEVIDGGTLYDDTQGPILVSFAPTENTVSKENSPGMAVTNHSIGSVFKQDGQLYQALENTLAGANLSDESKFLQVLSLPDDGEVFPESLRRYSDLDNFAKGDLVFYEGKLYQASTDFGPSQILTVSDGNAINKDLTKGEVVHLEQQYFQVLTNLKKGTEIEGLGQDSYEVGQRIGGNLLALGTIPPAKVEDLSYIIQTISNDGTDRWFLDKSYQQGDLVKFEDKYFQVSQNIYRQTEIPELAALLQSEADYAIGDEFGSFTAVANPSPDFLEENGSLYLSSNKKEFIISDLVGSLQSKEVTIEQIPETYEFSFKVSGELEPYKIIGGPGFQSIEEQILGLRNSKDQQVFDVEVSNVDEQKIVKIIGKKGISDDFEVSESAPAPSSVIQTSQPYIADKFVFTIQEIGSRFESVENVPVSSTFEIDYKGSSAATANAIVEEIGNNADLSELIEVKLVDGKISIVSKKDIGSDYDLELLQGVSDDHNIQLPSEPREIDLLKTTPPDVDQNIKEEFIFGDFIGTESIPSQYELDLTLNPDQENFSLIIQGQVYSINTNNEENSLVDLERLQFIETQLNEIGIDGSKFEGTPALEPAFQINLQEPNTISITGNEGAGIVTIPPQIGLTKLSSDKYDISIDGETISVPALGSEEATVQSIAQAINDFKLGNDLVTASAEINENGKWTLKLQANAVGPSISELINLKFTDSVADEAFLNASSATIVAKGSTEVIELVTYKATSFDFKRATDVSAMTEKIIRFKQNEIYYQADDSSPSGYTHFIVDAPLDVSFEDISNFDPTSLPWRDNFKSFLADLLDPADPSTIIRKSYPTGHNLDNGNLIELNIGLGEAVVKGGEIVGFNILNGGNGLPLTDSISVDGKQLELDSGVIKGYQNSRAKDVENFRHRLNDLVSTFVEEINEIYNPDDQPGSYLFGFDAVLTRPVTGRNLLMEEEFGYKGREGDAYVTLYRDEVDMTLPFASSEDFSIVNTTPIYSEDFRGVDTVNLFRGGDVAETTFRADGAGDLFRFYGSASRMNFVTMENDDSYPGADLSPGTEDDGRSLMMAYETIPFRIEGLEEGSKLPIIGDNFTFSALPANPWNLASSLKIDHRLTADSLLAGDSGVSGSNEIAQAISELGDGTFVNKVAMLNAELGTGLGDLNDNLDHQKSIETLLLDQRRAVSSVSIDEEVADLMRFQRSFQASSRVLTTLDKMLEIVVMGLVK